MKWKTRVAEAAKVVGLDKEYFTEHPFFLNKGMRQRVAIASILALKPKVIIVDEPTTGQDIRQSLEIMDFLRDLNQNYGHIIIFITHDMPIVSSYAQRVVAMGLGQVIVDGPARSRFCRTRTAGKNLCGAAADHRAGAEPERSGLCTRHIKSGRNARAVQEAAFKI